MAAAKADDARFGSSEAASLTGAEELLRVITNDRLDALGESIRSRQAVIKKWDTALLSMGAKSVLLFSAGLRQEPMLAHAVPLSSISGELTSAYYDATGVVGSLLASERADALRATSGVRSGLETAASDLVKLNAETEQALSVLGTDVGSAASDISTTFVSASPTISRYAHTLATICGVGTLATFWVPAVGEAFAACDVGASAAAMLADAVDPQTSRAQKAAMVGLDAVGLVGGTVGIASAAGLAADMADAETAAGNDYTTTLLTDAMLGDYTSVSEDEAASSAEDAVLTNAKEMELVPKLLELSGYSLADFEVSSGMVSPQAFDASLAALEAKTQTSPETLGLVQSLTGGATLVEAALYHAPVVHSVTTEPNRKWTGSGVQLSAGELVQVVATGRVWYNVNQPKSNWTWSTPAGWPWGARREMPPECGGLPRSPAALVVVVAPVLSTEEAGSLAHPKSVT